MYRVNEIFYSLQGEGRHTGRPAVFVRFSGCNQQCPFCDTQHDDGRAMTATDILSHIGQWSHCRFVVLTGGEPSLQVDKDLVNALHDEGYFIAVETNGTRQLPDGIDWVTLSPKNQFTQTNLPIVQTKIDEIKVVFDGKCNPEEYTSLSTDAYLSLQPCDNGNADSLRATTQQCVDYVLAHPHWNLSLQTHKMLGIE